MREGETEDKEAAGSLVPVCAGRVAHAADVAIDWCGGREKKQQLAMSQVVQQEAEEERDRLRESLAFMQEKFIDLQHHERQVAVLTRKLQ